MGLDPFDGFKLNASGRKAVGYDYLRHFLDPRVITGNCLREDSTVGGLSGTSSKNGVLPGTQPGKNCPFHLAREIPANPVTSVVWQDLVAYSGSSLALRWLLKAARPLVGREGQVAPRPT